MRISGFEAYHLFLALKNHFHTENYDYFKYAGKIRASEHSFLVKRDRIFFEEAARRYTREDLTDLIISNLLVGRKWFIDMIRNEREAAEKVRMEYVKRKESFSYLFAQDLDRMLGTVSEPKQLFSIEHGSYPEIINHYLNRNVPVETLSALDMVINFSCVFDRKLGKDDVIWEPTRLLIKKYKPFLRLDESKLQEIIRDKMINRE